MTITAKYSATCPHCTRSINPGDKIEWSKGTRATHTTCGARSASSSTPAGQRRSVRPGKWTGCSCGSREDGAGTLIPARNNCESCNFDA